MKARWEIYIWPAISGFSLIYSSLVFSPSSWAVVAISSIVVVFSGRRTKGVLVLDRVTGMRAIVIGWCGVVTRWRAEIAVVWIG